MEPTDEAIETFCQTCWDNWPNPAGMSNETLARIREQTRKALAAVNCGMPVGWWYEDETGCFHMSRDMELAKQHEAAGAKVNWFYSAEPSRFFEPAPSLQPNLLSKAVK